MRRKKKRRARKAADEHTHLVIKVDRCEVRATAGINRHAHAPEYAWRNTRQEPLYKFETDLEIAGTCAYPGERAGDSCDLTIYCDDNPDSDIYLKLKDVQLADEHYAPRYRTYRGKEIPLYAPPKGMGSFGKMQGERRWHGAIWAQPRFITDLLVLLGQGRQLFLSIHERKIQRQRWIQRISVQTTDPAEE